MSLEKPTQKVEYSETGAAWTDISTDVLEFSLEQNELIQGVGTFSLRLNNKNGKYETPFPTIPTEKGCFYLIRFTVNNTILLIGRVDAMVPESSEGEGDVLRLEGKDFAQELLNIHCGKLKQYNRERGDTIIYDQMTQSGPWNDVSYPSYGNAPRYTTRTKDNQEFRSLVEEVCENVGWVAYVDSRTKPAPFLLFAKNDTTKRLNILLKSVLYASDNNVKAGSAPRDLRELKNYFTLKDLADLNGYIPSDGDGWTEYISWTDPEGTIHTQWTALTGAVSLDSAKKVLGSYSIKCLANGMNPIMQLSLPDSKYGTVFDQVEEQGETIYFSFAKSPGSGGNRVDVEILLVDDENHTIWKDVDTFNDENWHNIGVPIGSANNDQWSGDTANFTWKIKQIRFADMGTVGVDDRIIWADAIYFYCTDGAPVDYVQDTNSVNKYGKRQRVLDLPEAFPFLNVKRWAKNLLEQFKRPMRTLNLRCLVDPATVKLYGTETSAPLVPGYSVRVQIPRWNVNLPASGVWWRILKVVHRFSEQGYEGELDLVPTGAESVDEDFSKLAGDRYRSQRDIIGAINKILFRKVEE